MYLDWDKLFVDVKLGIKAEEVNGQVAVCKGQEMFHFIHIAQPPSTWGAIQHRPLVCWLYLTDMPINGLIKIS